MRNSQFSTTPELPGDFNTVELLQKFNNGQIRRKGFNQNIEIGSNEIKIQLPGSTKLLLGINIFDTSGDPANNASLLVNGDSRIEEVSIFHLTRVINAGGSPAVAPFTGNEFFKVFCPLSGNDTTSLKIQCNTAGFVFICVYYVNTPTK